VERVFPQLTFDRLTAIEHQAVAGVSRLFVLEQAGRALSFPLGPGAPEASVFLDISSRVYTSHNEEGLLGLAFDPAFQSNGYLYVYYSASPPRRNVLSRFTASADRLSADPGSELIILESPKPFGNHNGGQIAFGPDGHLYIGIGDGGGSGDPEGHGQNTGDLLGSILRMDVRNAAVGAPYAIPPDNPFASKTGARGEIWAYGLRNPWRFSFDQQGRLWIADVGQFNREEIDLGVKGANYGWPIVEGTRCFSQSQSACTRNDLTGPIWEYTHEEGCSVTGGYVLADPRLPWLHGAYIAADFCSGKVWAVRYENGKAEATELVDTSLGITTFGLGPDGTLYIGSRSQGLYRLVPA
jgi:glucose/arabinose dehydrogenase